MANLGTVGIILGQGLKLGVASQVLNYTGGPPRVIVMAGGSADRIYLGRKSTTDGSPTQPSLELTFGGIFRFRWAVKSGTRTISVKVANVSGLTPYPTVTVRANPEIGVNTDVLGTAIAGTGWQTIGPLSVSPSSDGLLAIELAAWNGAYNRTQAITRWDDVSDSTGRSDQFSNWLNGAPVIDINETISAAVTRVFGSVG